MLANIVEEAGEQLLAARVGAEERAFYEVPPVPARAIDLVRADLDKCSANKHLRYNLARDRTRRDPRRGLARRLPPAAAIIAQAVFCIVSVICMAGSVSIFDL